MSTFDNDLACFDSTRKRTALLFTMVGKPIAFADKSTVDLLLITGSHEI
jgi:hypothetical protein